MNVMRDTSQYPIGPCCPLEQSPSGDSLMHTAITLLSSALDWGGEEGGMAMVVLRTAVANSDPRDPENVILFFSFQRTRPVCINQDYYDVELAN